MTLPDLRGRGLDRLRVACRTCGRVGSYRLDQALDRWGDAKLTDMLLEITADCPRGRGVDPYDRCGAYYPTLT